MPALQQPLRHGERLRQHCKTVHEKVQAHACPYCDGVAFGQESNLNTHDNRAALIPRHGERTVAARRLHEAVRQLGRYVPSQCSVFRQSPVKLHAARGAKGRRTSQCCGAR